MQRVNRRMKGVRPIYEVESHRRDLDLDDFLRICFVVEAIAQQVTEVA